jgi:hypothetical protein
MVNALVPLLSPNPEPFIVIVAPAFASVGVTPVIRGCGAVEGGDEDVGVDVNGDGDIGSFEFEQPNGRTAADNAKIDRIQLTVLDGMVFSPI